MAVGTVFELDAAQPGHTTLVLTPLTPGQAGRLPTADVIVTVGSVADVAALDGWSGPAVVKLASSMQRFGARPAEVGPVLDAPRPGPGSPSPGLRSTSPSPATTPPARAEVDGVGRRAGDAGA